MSALDVTLCMIVKDEELHLERCLRSVCALVSEIIIGDTGSQDRTVDIAQKYGATLVRVPWEDDFAKARNAVLELATCSWILVLDADEEAVHWCPHEVEGLIGDPKAYGYFLQLESMVGTGTSEQEYVTDAVCRLFRNDPRIRFRGTLHEEAAESVAAISGGPIPFVTLRIRHYGYRSQEIERKQKNQRNLALIERALAEKPDDLQLRYALGTECFQAERYTEAAEQLVPLLAEVPADRGFVSDMYLKAAYALYRSGQTDAMRSVTEQGLALYPDFTDLLEVHSLMLMGAGENQPAYEALLSALRAGDVSAKYSSFSGSGTYRTHVSAGQLCERLLRFDDALEHYLQAIEFRPDYMPAWHVAVPLCLLHCQLQRMAAVVARLPEGSLTSEHAALLLPALSNARALAEVPTLLSSLARMRPAPDLRLPFALLHWSGGEHSEAIRLWQSFSRQYLPGYTRAISYLWAASWELNDLDAADYWFNALEQTGSPLGAIHRYLRTVTCLMGSDDKAVDRSSRHVVGGSLGEEQADERGLGEEAISLAAQLTIQLGAWHVLDRLWNGAVDVDGGECAESGIVRLNIRWTRLPPSLWCGLISAPASFRERWCHGFRSRGVQSNEDEAAEALLYSSLAAEGGAGERWLKEALLRHQRNPAVRAGLAYAWRHEARRFIPQLGAGSLEPLLLVRASRLF
ncbi:tetratricopeptide repeat protein [Paenibacillus rigui]|uniref:Glycosyltransferase 2-like domain-containing protein n=1 Tax=Paenibacillus rigui TaxID=554312 RepID=A0A229UPB7_9BACL|nr:tetratricopeptide repeat protein [Paenibacillus rigui]OXM85065.1 hypothetical protein CF651_15740 [Paenibacillus rigui]